MAWFSRQGTEQIKGGINQMVYQWKNGSHISSNPQIAGEMCEALEAEGRLTAKDLLDANRPEDAPLHKEFEWNDGIAAEKYREQQARHIINCLVTVHAESEPTRSFFNIERSESTYQSVTTIIRQEDTREKLFAMALRELAAFEQKYASLKELAMVFQAANELRKHA
jgi:hypothetical protein